MIGKVTIFLVSVLLSFSWVFAEDVVLLENSVVDLAALNFAEGSQTKFSTNINGRTYQQYPQATCNGYQYVTYYDSDRNVCVGRRTLPDGAWEVIHLQDYTIAGHDSHNVTAIGVCTADGTIHLAFDHHADGLNYRVSAQGVVTNPESVVWDSSLFGPVTNYLGSIGPITSLTYPRFIPAPNGNLFLYYRYGGSGNGDGMIQEYDGTAHTWTPGLGKFISRQGTYDGPVTPNSTSRNPYINGISFAGNRLHASWGWRETSTTSQSNHDICYAYSDDYGRTWFNNDGTVIGITGSNYIDVDSPGLVVVDIEQGISLSNQYTHYAYPDGSVHVMVAHNTPATNSKRYQHYWRNPAGLWSGKALSFSGSRPKLAGTDDGTLFLVYSTGGHIRIAKGVPNTDMTDWSWSSVYTQPETSGGEGHFDLMRWKTEGILSVYDQERPSVVLDYGSGTPIDGMPSALYVYDYDVGYIIPETPELKLHYPLDGGLLDVSGKGNDGTLFGGSFAPSLVKHDQGLVLDGVDDYVGVSGYQGVTGTTGRTCSTWVKTSHVSGEIVSWGNSNNGAKWIVRVNETGSLRAEVQGGYIYGTTSINDGLWHHVAVVLDSDSSPDISEVQLYVDGQLDTIAGVNAYPINTAAAQDVSIGVYSTVGKRYFHGMIDDVRIYSYALTQAEIQTLSSITPPSPDIVPDNVIDLSDLSALSAYWLNKDCYSADHCDGRDLNADQVVDHGDFLVLAEKWLSSIDPRIYSFSSTQTGNEPEKILDGDSDDNSRWSAQQFPQWVIIDYGRTISIKGTRLWTYQDRAYQFTIEASNLPTSNYITIVNRSANTDGIQPIGDDFTAVDARYLRLTITGASGYTGDWCSITEFQIVEQ